MTPLIVKLFLILSVLHCVSSPVYGDTNVANLSSPIESKKDQENSRIFYPTASKINNKEIDTEMQRKFLRVFDKSLKYSNSSDSRNPPSDRISAAEKSNFRKCTPEIFFADMDPFYNAAMLEFKSFLMESANLMELFDMALKFRDEINFSLWLKGLIGSLLSRSDAISPFIPLFELKPDMFISSTVLQKVREESLKSADNRACVAIDEESGRENGIENELWYFREDLMVNLHHSVWYQYFPNGGIKLDRQGELYYYMHHSILARYHAERLSNGLPPVLPLDIKVDGIVEEPYSSFLEDTNSGKKWSNRPPNSVVKDVTCESTCENGPGGTCSEDRCMGAINITDSETHRVRLTKSAYSKRMKWDNESFLDIGNTNGIDFLGRSTRVLREDSVNYHYYGDFDDDGSLIIANILDPNNSNGRGRWGVMADSATAMRDPAFYRWHTTIDNIFAIHKATLRPYASEKTRPGEWGLSWRGVSIENLQVNSIGRKSTPPLNTLYTFWTVGRRFDLIWGLDLRQGVPFNKDNGPIDVCVKHLNHDEFEFEITVTKTKISKPTPRPDVSKATVRIFLAPHFNHENERYTFEEQRKLFFVLDTFTVDLSIGQNVIRRSSKDSELTLEFAKSMNVLEGLNDKRTYCGCGWPHHLLVPKGKPTGMIFDLFVMATDGEKDAVVDDSSSRYCSQGYLYCGIQGRKYPDERPMGFPFDRSGYSLRVPGSPSRPVANLDEFVGSIHNMKSIQVTIMHEQERKEPSQL